jgi:hypothetical protein
VNGDIGGEVAQWYHRFDLKYRLGELRGAASRGACVVRLSGSPVLLTAPHSVTQVRNGREKPAEFWSGALTETLGELLEANVVTALSPRTEQGGAASSDVFRNTAEMVLATRDIRLVIDVHGMRADRGIDINVGTAGAAADLDAIGAFTDVLRRVFVVTVDEPFSGHAGMAGFVNSRFGTTTRALQLECGVRLRRDVIDEGDLRHLGEAIGHLSRGLIEVP